MDRRRAHHRNQGNGAHPRRHTKTAGHGAFRLLMDAALQSISAKPFVKRYCGGIEQLGAGGRSLRCIMWWWVLKNSDTTGAPASIRLQASSIKYRQSLQRRKEPSSIVSDMFLLDPIRFGGTVTRTATEAVYTVVISGPTWLTALHGRTGLESHRTLEPRRTVEPTTSRRTSWGGRLRWFCRWALTWEYPTRRGAHGR